MTAVIEAGPSSIPHPRPYVAGIAPIKPEYILAIDRPASRQIDDDAAEAHTGPTHRPSAKGEKASDVNGQAEDDEDALANGGGGSAQARGQRRGDHPSARGKNRVPKEKGGAMNKKRKVTNGADEVQICNDVSEGKVCAKGDKCRFSHSVPHYLANKARDIYLPEPPKPSSDNAEEQLLHYGSLRTLPQEDVSSFLDRYYSTTAPYVSWYNENLENGISGPLRSLDGTTTCPLIHARKARLLWDASASESDIYCPFGLRCRFLGNHAKIDNSESASSDSVSLPWQSLDQEQGTSRKSLPEERNFASSNLARALRKKEYNFGRTKKIVEMIEAEDKLYRSTDVDTNGPMLIDIEALDKAGEVALNGNKPPAVQDEDDLDALMNSSASRVRAEEAASSQSKSDVDRARIRRSEKRKLDWYHGELYLAPLTTNGNLPFRRICATFGSDIHCGEMGLAQSFLEGNGSEWSLTRRWEGEKCFGVQLCGSRPELLVPTAEIMSREYGSGGLDFVDINCGCPIDLVVSKGGGSALLDHPRKLGKIVRGLDAVLDDIPVTIKLRTGVTEKRTSHHRIMPKAQTEWGVSAVTMHGRSRQQRYSRKADWDYIRLCAKELRESVQRWNEESRHADEDEMRPVPILGNGDIYSQGVEGILREQEETGVDALMIARGALIKPWIFTELKEKRDWDISSRERLDIIRQFAQYGLSHWGSDTRGVSVTRRFLCEALGFFHRYIPIGLLEHLPPSMNDRPPAYRGRDDLETLLASDDAGDWIRISEMFLGKADDAFKQSFKPKHKSNSFLDSAEQQG